MDRENEQDPGRLVVTVDETMGGYITASMVLDRMFLGRLDMAFIQIANVHRITSAERQITKSSCITKTTFVRAMIVRRPATDIVNWRSALQPGCTGPDRPICHLAN